MGFIQELLVLLKGDTKGLEESLSKAETATKDFKTQTESASDAVEYSYSRMGAAAAAAMVILAGETFYKLSDRFATLTAQIKNVTESADEQKNVFQGLYETSKLVGVPINDLVETYIGLNAALPESVNNSYDLVKVVDLISRGFAATGADAQEAYGLIMQLTQGLANNFRSSNRELNSLIQGAPALAKSISEQLGGKAATDLKTFADQGKLTSEVFIAALMSAQGTIKSFEIPETIPKSIQALKNDVLIVAGNMNKATGASTGLSGVLKYLGFVTKSVGAAVTTASTAIQAYVATLRTYFISIAGGVATLSKAVVSGVNVIIGALNKIPGIKIAEFDTSGLDNYIQAIKDAQKESISLGKAGLASGLKDSADQLKFALGETSAATDKASKSTDDYSEKVKTLMGDLAKNAKSTGNAEKSAQKDRHDSLAEYQRDLEETRRKQEEVGNEIGDTLFNLARGYSSFRDVAIKALDDVLRSMFRLSAGGTDTGGISGTLAKSVFSNFGGLSFLNSSNTAAFSSRSTLSLATSALSGAYGPGFASGGSFVVQGNPGIDRNLLSLNGQPIANVAKGETVAVGKSSGSGVVVNQTINVSTGVQQTVAAEMARYMPAIKKQTVSAVEDAQRRGRL